MMDEDNYRNNGRAGDDPQAAFEQLRGEVALVRLAVEGLARARESIEIPDYQPTLANTEKILLALTQRVDVIAKSPAMKLTPETMGERVNASVASATGELHNLVNSTRSDMSEAARELRGLIGTTRARWQQDRWLFWIGLGGVVLGILVYALLDGLIARAMPDSWQLDRKKPRDETHPGGDGRAGKRFGGGCDGRAAQPGEQHAIGHERGGAGIAGADRNDARALATGSVAVLDRVGRRGAGDIALCASRRPDRARHAR